MNNNIIHYKFPLSTFLEETVPAAEQEQERGQEKELNFNGAGVYQLVNLTNQKSYVGSSVNLKRRIKEYLNPLYIHRNLKKGNSIIMNAILKYGYTNFEIKILDTIAFNDNQSKSDRKSIILAREQYYLDLIKPEYNINNFAGSNLGSRQRTTGTATVAVPEVRNKMSLAKKDKPGNKKGAILSEETRSLMRENSGGSARALSIIMLNENNEVLAKFKSIQIASDVTGISRNRISSAGRYAPRVPGATQCQKYQKTNNGKRKNL